MRAFSMNERSAPRLRSKSEFSIYASINAFYSIVFFWQMNSQNANNSISPSFPCARLEKDVNVTLNKREDLSHLM